MLQNLSTTDDATILLLPNNPFILSHKIETMTKGRAIRFQDGKYFGKTGWMDADKRPTPKMYYVIVDLGDGTLKSTKVMKTSVGNRHEPPTSYAMAAIQQHPDIEKQITKLCRDLAECSIGRDAQGLFRILEKNLSEATETQDQMGSGARYRRVDFSGPPT
jgi:hypothetical protein